MRNHDTMNNPFFMRNLLMNLLITIKGLHKFRIFKKVQFSCFLYTVDKLFIFKILSV